ncbi:MAG: glycoside hydrolase family 5 protein [Tannerellaceae bacterium]|jgi:aryl-phospho-beta-D-glucosidase BglC (GH1 family)|nr:glycoside hydrolase family 5 protein [Tannerellaceae bacterium]
MKTFSFSLLFLALFLSVGCQQAETLPREAFVRVNGPDLITPDGQKLLIRGTNLGNWLNPEGYMFRFGRTNSAGRIHQAFCEMLGPDFVDEFWKQYKDKYVTKADILFLKATGCNTIRLPFHYKLFTDEDYMGLYAAQDGFQRIDTLVDWCREAGLYLILDMHDAPGGQTGDNIDDSYGYPWLFESEASQQKFIDIWVKIAAYYTNEPVILGYEFINEPIAPYFDIEEFNTKLEPLYRRTLAEVRKVDPNHIVLLGGAQWNGNFKPLSQDASFDDNVMYTCHRYGGEASAEAIRGFIEFRDKVNRPMYMGEIGHNTNEWMSAFRQAMEENNIGWTFWPYKKMAGSSFVSINDPEHWDKVVAFVESPRSTYKEIREARPEQALARQALLDFAENSLFGNCTINEDYLRALGLKTN